MSEIQMLLSYYPAAAAEIAVLHWAAVSPYWQAAIPPASCSPARRALRPLFFGFWVDSSGSVLLETITSFAEWEGGSCSKL